LNLFLQEDEFIGRLALLTYVQKITLIKITTSNYMKNKEKIENLIVAGRLEEAIHILLKSFKDELNEKELLLLKSRYYQYIKNKNMGLLSEDNPELNKIKMAIIELDSNLEDRFDPDLEDVDEIKRLTKRINKCSYFKNKLIVKDGPTFKLPKLVNEGSYEIPKRIEDRSNLIINELKKNDRPNDPCAAIIDSPMWASNPLHLHYHPMLYSQIKSFREDGVDVKMLSVNAVLFCEDEEFVLVHRRSKKSDDYIHTLHTFGGAFMPSELSLQGDLGGLRECARREIGEETGIGINIPELTPTITIDEFNISYIQTTFLGINVSKTDLINLRPNWEGTVQKIKFADLESNLKNINLWTPTGWLHILYWLALNTPNSKRKLTFSNKSSLALASELMDYLEEIDNSTANSAWLSTAR